MTMSNRYGRLLVPLLIGLVGIACTQGHVQGRVDRNSVEGVADKQSDARAPTGCSRKRVPHERKEVRAVAFARGSGPVFVGLGTASVVKYTEDTRHHKGWYYNKALWAISPKYKGAVMVSGEQLDGSNELRFNAASGFPGQKLSALEFDEADRSGWRYGPSDTLIRADGCYALRIQGEDFVQWVTFIARS
jgi:hypothetical protein